MKRKRNPVKKQLPRGTFVYILDIPGALHLSNSGWIVDGPRWENTEHGRFLVYEIQTSDGLIIKAHAKRVAVADGNIVAAVGGHAKRETGRTLQEAFQQYSYPRQENPETGENSMEYMKKVGDYMNAGHLGDYGLTKKGEIWHTYGRGAGRAIPVHPVGDWVRYKKEPHRVAGYVPGGWRGGFFYILRGANDQMVRALPEQVRPISVDLSAQREGNPRRRNPYGVLKSSQTHPEHAGMPVYYQPHPPSYQAILTQIAQSKNAGRLVEWHGVGVGFTLDGKRIGRKMADAARFLGVTAETVNRIRRSQVGKAQGQSAQGTALVPYSPPSRPKPKPKKSAAPKKSAKKKEAQPAPAKKKSARSKKPAKLRPDSGSLAARQQKVAKKQAKEEADSRALEKSLRAMFSDKALDRKERQLRAKAIEKEATQFDSDDVAFFFVDPKTRDRLLREGFQSSQQRRVRGYLPGPSGSQGSLFEQPAKKKRGRPKKNQNAPSQPKRKPGRPKKQK